MDENEVIGTQEVINEPKKEVVFRHPQQILTEKEIQILLTKEKEELTEIESKAIKLFLLRAKHHGSKPKVLSGTQRAHRKVKRKLAKKSRKINQKKHKYA
jgi:ABC-type oligopeptide transport system ATPase subunit